MAGRTTNSDTEQARREWRDARPNTGTLYGLVAEWALKHAEHLLAAAEERDELWAVVEARDLEAVALKAQVGALREALERARDWRGLDGDGITDPVRAEVNTVLADTAAAAQAHDEKVRQAALGNVESVVDEAYERGAAEMREHAALRARASACLCALIRDNHPERIASGGAKFGIEHKRHLSECPYAIAADIHALPLEDAIRALAQEETP